jgi:hypothetical protein
MNMATRPLYVEIRQLTAQASVPDRDESGTLRDESGTLRDERVAGMRA